MDLSGVVQQMLLEAHQARKSWEEQPPEALARDLWRSMPEHVRVRPLVELLTFGAGNAWSICDRPDGEN